MADISVIKQTTNTYNLSFTRNGVAENITGWTVFFTVKKNNNQTDADSSISKTITVHTNASGGETQIVLSPTETDIEQGNYVYDITYIDSSGNRKTIDPEKFIVIGNVTRRNS